MIVDSEFLKQVAKRNKHTFISTGMSTKENIDNAVSIFRKNNCSFELMHCVSTYPMKVEDANLITIEQLKKNIIVTWVTAVMRTALLYLSLR